MPPPNFRNSGGLASTTGSSKQTAGKSNFARSSSSIAGNLGNMKRELRELDLELKQDLEGKAEYENMLDRLKRRKADLEASVRKKEMFIEGFDCDLGPFEQKYKELVDNINTLYGEAKSKHAEAIEIFVRDFAKGQIGLE